MNDLVLNYQHQQTSQRGLAASGIIFVKLLLVIPHAIVVVTLQTTLLPVAYIGYWAVALTGTLPQWIHRLTEISLGWSARMWGWLTGIVDPYPPFETEPDYPISFPLPRREQPSRGWATVGIFMFKFVAAIPHIVVIAILGIAMIFAKWIGYWAVLFTGALPTTVQDFIAGVVQWQLRVTAWVVGITDNYPPWRMDAHPGS